MATKLPPTSVRLSDEEERILAQIAFDHQCDNSDAIRLLIHGYSKAKIPPPITPALSALKDVDQAIKALMDFTDALHPTVRFLHVRHLPAETKQRKEEIEKWHAKAREVYDQFENAIAQLRYVRFGVLATRDLDIEKLRAAEALLINTCQIYANDIKNPGPNSGDVCVTNMHLQFINELRRFLHACGIRSQPIHCDT